jgi:hypothetical protein
MKRFAAHLGPGVHRRPEVPAPRGAAELSNVPGEVVDVPCGRFIIDDGLARKGPHGPADGAGFLRSCGYYASRLASETASWSHSTRTERPRGAYHGSGWFDRAGLWCAWLGPVVQSKWPGLRAAKSGVTSGPTAISVRPTHESMQRAACAPMSNANAVRSLHRHFMVDVGAINHAARPMTADLGSVVVKSPEFGIRVILKMDGPVARLLDD